MLVDADLAFYRGLRHVQRKTSSRSSMFVLNEQGRGQGADRGSMHEPHAVNIHDAIH